MEKMKPMQPMKPMKPMEPMSAAERWWSEDLGYPSSSGSQNQMRYAFFPQDYLLLIEVEGEVKAYDSGNHQITGVAQSQSESQTLTFASLEGSVDLNDLKPVDVPE